MKCERCRAPIPSMWQNRVPRFCAPCVERIEANLTPEGKRRFGRGLNRKTFRTWGRHG